MIRLIATDMDGTLLIHGIPGIPKENLQALQEAAAKGVHLAICSGRTAEDISFFASDAGLDVHVLSLNGSYCLEHPHGACVRDQRVKTEDAIALCRMADNTPGMIYGVMGGEDTVLSYAPSSPEELTLSWGTNLLRPGCKAHVYVQNEGLEALIARGVNKLLLVDMQHTGILEAMKERINRELPGLEVTSSWENNLEIMPRGVDKGGAVKDLAARLGIPMEEVMTLGDNENDASMLACAGCGVAMTNATSGAKAAARYLTTSNEAFGVALAIRRWVL